jgi:hypothetical protein
VKGLRILKVFLVTFLIALTGLTAINTLLQIHAPYDQYFALFTLGSSGKTEHYFPGEKYDIFQGTRMSWFVGVYNHMGTVQLVKVVFKFLNSTIEGPDQLHNIPGNRTSFYETTRLLLSNDTWMFPVGWSVLNATQSANATVIHVLLFNGETLSENVEVEALHGYNFRMVIELWAYDQAIGDFTFAWEANGAERSAWNQIWFNMTRVTLLPT